MEIRDVIPSQNQIAIQKSVETSNRRFQDLMNRKFAGLSRKQYSESVSQSHQEVKSSEVSGRAQSEVNKVPDQGMSQREKELSKVSSKVSSESGATKIEEEAIKDDAAPEELIQSTRPAENFSQFVVAVPLSLDTDCEHSEMNEEVEAVSLEAAEVSEMLTGKNEKSEEASVGKTVMFETDRVNLKQLYEVHEVVSETDYAEMLEVLSSEPKEIADELQSASLLGNDEIGQDHVAIADENFAETPEKPVESTLTAIEKETSKVMRKSEDSPKRIEDSKELKVEFANERTVSEPKAKNKEQQTFSDGQFFSKTESVRHHENMVGVAPRVVMKQVAEAIAVNVKVLSDGQALEVKLSPEHLGKVIMKIELKEGQMVANIKVENPEVKSALEASIQELREALSARGVSVKEINVGVSKDGHRGGQEYTGDNRKNDRDEEETKDFRSVLAREE